MHRLIICFRLISINTHINLIHIRWIRGAAHALKRNSIRLLIRVRNGHWRDRGRIR